jgi:hypothetical protein
MTGAIRKERKNSRTQKTPLPFAVLFAALAGRCFYQRPAAAGRKKSEVFFFAADIS